MHNTDVNTESQKHKRQLLDGLEKLLKSAPKVQSALFKQFDDDAMGERDSLLGVAGRALNQSFDTIFAIGGLVDLMRASDDEMGDFHNVINDANRAQILTGISLLADSLNDLLSDISMTFHKEITAEKGGV